MRALVQRVAAASVRVRAEGAWEEHGTIGAGLVALVGVTHDDTVRHADRLAAKIWGLRVFDDEHGTMNRSAGDVKGEILVVSQFTLYADTRKGRRPSYVAAAPPAHAEPLVEEVVAALQRRGAEVATGRFRAHMRVELINDGPVTLLLDVPAVTSARP